LRILSQSIDFYSTGTTNPLDQPGYAHGTGTGSCGLALGRNTGDPRLPPFVLVFRQTIPPIREGTPMPRVPDGKPNPNAKKPPKGKSFAEAAPAPKKAAAKKKK
jgi:hypothetical protein